MAWLGGRNRAKMMENGSEVKTMILAGDIGGTKTLLGLFDAAPARPPPARALAASGTRCPAADTAARRAELDPRV